MIRENDPFKRRNKLFQYALGRGFENQLILEALTDNICTTPSESSSVGRARPCQGRGREFESRLSLSCLGGGTGRHAGLKSDGVLHISLEELNVVPAEFSDKKLLSKGFFKSTDVQDFPIRGQRVFLKIKRRRWIDTDTEKLVYRDWNLIAKGTRVAENSRLLKKSIDTMPL